MEMCPLLDLCEHKTTHKNESCLIQGSKEKSMCICNLKHTATSIMFTVSYNLLFSCIRVTYPTAKPCQKTFIVKGTQRM
jgi:hypothetical protein